LILSTLGHSYLLGYSTQLEYSAYRLGYWARLGCSAWILGWATQLLGLDPGLSSRAGLLGYSTYCTSYLIYVID